jgi:predicted RNase H-like nuclease (RuvC/YqgF family)
MTTEIIISIISLIGGGGLGWLATRKKNKAEIEKINAETNKIILENMTTLLHTYKEENSFLNAKVDGLEQKIMRLTDMVEKLQYGKNVDAL